VLFQFQEMKFMRQLKKLHRSCEYSNEASTINNSTGWPKKLAHFLYALTSYALSSSNIDQFSNFVHCQNQG